MGRESLGVIRTQKHNAYGYEVSRGAGAVFEGWRRNNQPHRGEQQATRTKKTPCNRAGRSSEPEAPRQNRKEQPRRAPTKRDQATSKSSQNEHHSNQNKRNRGGPKTPAAQTPHTRAGKTNDTAAPRQTRQGQPKRPNDSEEALCIHIA